MPMGPLKRPPEIATDLSLEKAFEKRIETPVQKANRMGVPIIPRRYQLPVTEQNPVIAICGECGHELRSVSYISCPQGNCPMGNSKTLN